MTPRGTLLAMGPGWTRYFNSGIDESAGMRTLASQSGTINVCCGQLQCVCYDTDKEEEVFGRPRHRQT